MKKEEEEEEDIFDRLSIFLFHEKRRERREWKNNKEKSQHFNIDFI